MAQRAINELVFAIFVLREFFAIYVLFYQLLLQMQMTRYL